MKNNREADALRDQRFRDQMLLNMKIRYLTCSCGSRSPLVWPEMECMACKLLNDVLSFFCRQQKARLASILQNAERDIAKNEKTASQVRRNFLADEGIQLYLKVIKASPEKTIAYSISAGHEKAQKAFSDASAVKTRKQLARWWMETYNPQDEPPYETYKKMSRLNWKLFAHTRTSGYRPHVGQASLQLDFCLDHKPSGYNPCGMRAEMLDELGTWLPFIKPMAKEETDKIAWSSLGFLDWPGWRPVSIMEPALSAHGSYSLYIGGLCLGYLRTSNRNAMLRRGKETISQGKLSDVIDMAIKMFKVD